MSYIFRYSLKNYHGKSGEATYIGSSEEGLNVANNSMMKHLVNTMKANSVGSNRERRKA